MEKQRKKIISFRDLGVHQRTYKASILVMIKIIPSLPDSERYDLKEQLSKSSKAIPRLIAEGYAKRHQRRGFQKYLDDVMAECNEVVVCLSQCKDIYPRYIDIRLCEELIEEYNISGKQVYRLAESWSRFKSRKSPTA